MGKMTKRGTDMMSLTEFCSTTGIGRNHGYNAINAGKIPHIRIGKRILISRKIVAEMLDPPAAANGQQPTQPTPIPPKTSDPSLPVRRGGARLSTEKFNELMSAIDALRAGLQEIGDQVMRLRIIQEDLKRDQKP